MYPNDTVMSTMKSWQAIHLLMHGKGKIHVVINDAIVQTNIFYISHY